MIIKLDESLEIEFGSWQMEQAAKVVDKIKCDHRERADDVLRSLLGLLMFGQIEHKTPGTLQRLIDEAGKTAQLLKGPQPEKTQ